MCFGNTKSAAPQAPPATITVSYEDLQLALRDDGGTFFEKAPGCGSASKYAEELAARARLRQQLSLSGRVTPRSAGF